MARSWTAGRELSPAVRRCEAARRRLRRRLVAALVLIVAGLAVPLQSGPAVAARIPATPEVCSPPLIDPTLTSFSISPTTIDVDSHSATVTFTIGASDSQADINQIEIYFRAKRGGYDGIGQAFSPSSGTGADGIWTAVVTIPRWAARGSWTVFEVLLYDTRYGEDSTQFQSDYYSRLPSWKTSWQSTFTVDSADIQPPDVTSVIVSPSSVNTSDASKNIKVTVKATDNLSGVSVISVVGSATIQGRRRVTRGEALTRSSGTNLDGTYTGTLTVPKWAGAGPHVWSLDLKAYDRSRNEVHLTATQLKGKGFASSVTVTSRGDTTKPKFTSLTIASTSADARSIYGAHVEVVVGGSDTGSGIAHVRVTMTSRSGGKTVDGLVPSSGTRTSGKWWSFQYFDECSEPGIWTVSVTLTDVLGNTVTVSAAQLKARHLQSTIRVQAYDVVPPRAVVPSTAPHAGPILVTFSEPTLWQGSAIPFTVHRSGTHDVVSGTWRCRDGGVAVSCNANDADVTTAVFEPASPLTVGKRYQVTSAAGIYDTSGNGPAQIKATFKAT
jgi:hypothetical protein